MMKQFRAFFLREDHVCPWWLAYTFDNPLRRLFHKPEEMFAPYLREGMTAVDIGCGMGYFSIAMAKMVGDAGSVISVDIQQEMLDILHRRAEKAGVARRIRLQRSEQGDIGITERVDFVLTFWMAHEVKDVRKFFKQVYSVLSDTGTLLIAEPKIHVPHRRFQEILGFAREAGFRISGSPAISLSRAAVLSKKA